MSRQPEEVGVNSVGGCHATTVMAAKRSGSNGIAPFQSGTYNLATIADQVPFRRGVAMLPTGPAGRVSVTNGIAAAGNSASKHPDAVRRLLTWMGSRRGN